MGQRQWTERNGRQARALFCACAALNGACALLGCSQQEPEASGAGPVEQQTAQAQPVHAFVHLKHAHQVRPDVISGAEPEGDAAFEELAEMGVKTILSVDGKTPDAEAARAHGMRYVHVPIQYSGITKRRRAEIIAVLRDCPRPIYIHCHHGLHRGPAATAFGLVSLGEMSAEDGLRFLEDAGTSPNYPGLFACVREAGATLPPVEADAINGLSLPEQAFPGTVAQSMSEIDAHWDNIKLIRAADWRTPIDHPDLAPAAEAGIVHDHFRTLDADATRSVGLAQTMRAAGEIASQLEHALDAHDFEAAEARFAALAQACKDCHAKWRNK